MSTWEFLIRDNGKGHIPDEPATTQLGDFPGRKQVLQHEASICINPFLAAAGEGGDIM